MKRYFPVLLVAAMIFFGAPVLADGSLSEEAEKVQSAAALNEQLALLHDLSVDHAPEFELGAWDVELNAVPAEEIPVDLIPDTENAVDTDALPEDFLEAKFFVLFDRFETDGSLQERFIPGFLYVRIPEANRAASLEEADAVLYLTENYESRSDYIGEAYNRVYKLYVARIGSSEVQCIHTIVVKPPQSGMGILTGERLDPEQIWAEMSVVFPTAELTADYPEGSAFFRVTGSGCCLTGVEGDFTRFEVPSEVDGMPVTGIESISSSSIKELILPEGIVYISGDYAIDCPGLTGISFPSTLRRITGEGVFERTGLTSLEFNEGLEEIGEDSLRGGEPLESVTLPDTIRILGNDFLTYGLTGTWVSLPEGLTKVPSGFLSTTNKVECVFMPASIEEFGINILNSTNSTRTYAPEGSAAAEWAKSQGEPFTPCDSPEDMPKPEIVSEGDFSYTIVEDEAILEKYTGSDEDVIVPDELGGCPVAVIKMFAFYENETIKSLTFPESAGMLERWCIMKCGALETVYIPGYPTEAYYFISQCDNCIVCCPEDSLAKREAESQNFTWEEWTP